MVLFIDQRLHQTFAQSPASSTGVGFAGVSKLDDGTDSSRLRIRASNVIMVLLHRDPFFSNTAGNNSEKEYCLEDMSCNFFNHVNQYSIQSLFGMNGEDIRENLVRLCTYDHLR